MHKKITREVINHLLPWQKKILRASGAELVGESSGLPDKYFDVDSGGYQQARPFAFFTQKVQFHYIPNTPVENRYKYWRVVENKLGEPVKLSRFRYNRLDPAWKHLSQGFRFYLTQATARLKEGRITDFAGYLGSLLHILQDATCYLHSLEGIDGTDILILDRLLVSGEEDFSRWPSYLLRESPEGEVRLLTPQVVGTSIPEASFLLYSRLWQDVSANRRLLLPLYLALINSDGSKIHQIRSEMLSRAGQLCLDVTHTVFGIAFERWSRSELNALEMVYLSDLKAIREPLGLSEPYRFITFLQDASLNQKMQTCPLSLYLEEKPGQWRKRVFKKGLGTGSHYHYCLAYEIPAGVYRSFSGAVGLHADLGRGGNINVSIRLNRKSVFRERFTDRYPGKRFWIDLESGGLLELVVTSDSGMRNARNNVVWADLVLTKNNV
ncbi:MAG: NPCBM/NEW2 domain-containing protein [Candidatus Omnitrophica bacterium]|nr:NPCBM/NEW2 domain-containing protein [Candidatus Omnitrophota bacterium]